MTLIGSFVLIVDVIIGVIDTVSVPFIAAVNSNVALFES
jgi:hypothetical protein